PSRVVCRTGEDDGNGEDLVAKVGRQGTGGFYRGRLRLASERRTTTNTFLAINLTPLIVDAPLRMRKPIRTLVLVLLSFGLLWLFLRGAHLGDVWTEIKS